MKDINLRRPEGIILPPLKAIRKFCIECMGNHLAEIPKCTTPKCWLFPFRMGNDSRREKKTISEAQLKAMQEGRERASSIVAERNMPSESPTVPD